MGDVRLFSTTENVWLPGPDVLDDGERRNRFNHAAAVYGSCLVLHGGYDGEEKRVLSDFRIFDLGN